MSFTPLESGIGGLVIGLSCALALLVDGRIAGCSGILGPFLRSVGQGAPKLWNAAWLVGLVAGGCLNWALNADFAFPGTLDLAPAVYVYGGLVIGVGTRLGTGCTSGHGLCGLARFSPRSLLGVVTFMSVGALSVYLTKLDKNHASPSVVALQWPTTNYAYYALFASVVIAGVTVALPNAIRATLAPLISGLLFGVGLGCSGMTSQQKVRGFLDVTGAWDPSLAFVMGCGLMVTVPTFAWARRPTTKCLTESCEIEAPGPGQGSKPIDFKLLLGTALFGWGWGACGICPGPVVAGVLPNSVKYWSTSGKWFLLCFFAICAGWLVSDALLTRWEASQREEEDEDELSSEEVDEDSDEGCCR